MVSCFQTEFLYASHLPNLVYFYNKLTFLHESVAEEENVLVRLHYKAGSETISWTIFHLTITVSACGECNVMSTFQSVITYSSPHTHAASVVLAFMLLQMKLAHTASNKNGATHNVLGN
jgi:hypothetical protein